MEEATALLPMLALIAADDHRLELGMVDVGRDDGAAAGDFATDEFGGDFARDGGAK